ncbi:hypothetical protein PUNSTDRAFT_139763 [Punctularia strigosozonata HHB-11173 SS5]|uniref:uncharacterized protein n=1 Tax=Punctularia strigosozonata (strain HHB-11173) TaxID=741275 RepID=UPI000441642E|nr:uncharacterized protein PUNSTDRAFT_139763 [Punctularia strigosozonata HHB-11173 SS5]EIN13098.1 hypothetical protein PUNSTDRAFT_139763 [Punctularia strigosozonata HHB-11173 SS5]
MREDNSPPLPVHAPIARRPDESHRVSFAQAPSIADEPSPDATDAQGDGSSTGRTSDPEMQQQEIVQEKASRNSSGDIARHRGDANEKGNSEVTKATRRAPIFTVPKQLRWIPANATWSKLKPAIRSALAAWLSLVLLLIRPVQQSMGQASFIILVASVLSPPSDQFMAVLEREFFILLFVTTSWAWSCLGIKLANLTRRHIVPNASSTSIFSGQYIEWRVTVIMAIFMFIGSATMLYIKGKGPGPYTFATVLSCICLSISLTSAPLFPYAYYLFGKTIVVPVAIHSAVALFCSLFFFPETVMGEYRTRLRAVFTPLVTSLTLHRAALGTDPHSPAFASTVSSIRTAVAQSEGALVPLAASTRLITRDITYGRIGPADLTSLQPDSRRLSVRANGMGVFFALVDPLRERFPMTPGPSRVGSPAQSRVGTPGPSRPGSSPGSPPGSPRESRPPSPSPRRDDLESGQVTPTSPVSVTGTGTGTGTGSGTYTKDREKAGNARRRRQNASRTDSSAHAHFRDIFQHHPHSPFNMSRFHHHHARAPVSTGANHHHSLHNSLFHFALQRNEPLVGVFESQRYQSLENRHYAHPSGERLLTRAVELLGQSCDGLLSANLDGLKGVERWLDVVRQDRWDWVMVWKRGREREKCWKEGREEVEKLHAALVDELRLFREVKRHAILEPYRVALDPRQGADDMDTPPHRYLFHCYVYQYHLMRFSQNLVDVLGGILKVEENAGRSRLWYPTSWLSRANVLWQSYTTYNEAEDRGEDEDPNVVQGIGDHWPEDLGQTAGRDPDAMPPANPFEWVMNFLYRNLAALTRGNAVFAIKAGVLTIVLALPIFIQSSAEFGYENRFIWGIFMGQLTLARFRGDTTFGLTARIFSTFGGGVLGLLMWYISTGAGHGSPYGLGAVTAIFFPFMFFGRLYWPVPPMTKIIFFVTAMLVVGYSWQDTHFPLFGSPGVGWAVAWRRFVLVTAGVTAAFIFSFLPPSTTLRRYQRSSLATTATDLGCLYCSIISFAVTHHARPSKDNITQEIVRSLIAIRAKLKRSIALKDNIIYEFSLRGKWPAERYQKICDTQLQIAYLLSNLMSVVEQLDGPWTYAFLQRTRFLDSDFQGDVLAVISLITTALRTGNPLPQITPCPLVDRFMLHQHGLNVLLPDQDDPYGLPRTVTIDTLENEQYLIFCVATTTAFNIMTRLDRLMVATKELVGEQYHIDGVGIRLAEGRRGIPMGSRTTTKEA